MSNAKYRQDEDLAASRREMLLIDARHVLAHALATDAKRVQELLFESYAREGGDIIDSQMESLQKIVRTGDLCRDVETEYLKKNLELMKKGEAPVEIPRSPVSAATQRAASRDIDRLRVERIRVMENAEIRAASRIRRESRFAEAVAKAEAQAEGPTAAASSASQPKAEGNGGTSTAPPAKRAAA